MAQDKLSHPRRGSQLKIKSSPNVYVTECLLRPQLVFNPSDENDGGNGIPGNSGNQSRGHNEQESSSGSSGRDDKRNVPSNHVRPLTFNEEDMKKESHRLKTFTKAWSPKFILPQDLAKAGFYYVVDDVVRCAFCRIEVGRWEMGDIPRKEHRRWSPSCPFVRGIPCGNIPMRESDASFSSSEGESLVEDNLLAYDVCGIHEELRPFSHCDDETARASCSKSKPLVNDVHGEPDELPRSSLEKLGIRDMRAPVYPDYCSEVARLNTYNQWPLAIKQRPKDLAEAGFYYTGNGDQTICFHCGGGLKDWEGDDDPWVEHAKWFSKCYYLKLVKGSEFISQVTASNPAIISAEEAKHLTNTAPVAAAQATVSPLAHMEVQNNIKRNSAASKETSVENSERKCEKNPEAQDDGRLCKICYSAELAVVFLPCGHMVACVKCASSLTVCPVCRQPYSHTVRAFLS